MSETRVEQGSDGSLRLFGVLDYQTGPALRSEGRALIGSGDKQRLMIDCSGVEKSSSVGLSLLLAFTRDARRAGREAVIVGMPDDMRDIARVSGLMEVLSLQEHA